MEADLVADVLANPGDDGPRLVLADHWLQQGNPRGEFTIAQCRLESDPDVANRAALAARVAELLAAYEDAWLAPYGVEARDVQWWRGFVDELTISWEELARRDQTVLASEPLRHATVKSVGEDLAALGALPWSPAFRSLRLENESSIDLTALVASPLYQQTLRSLSLYRCHLTDADLATLGLPGGHVHELDLDFNGYGSAGVAALVGRPLTSLSIMGNEVDHEGARAIARSSEQTKLAELTLIGNPIGAAGAIAIAESPHLRLRKLLMYSTEIGTDGIVALAKSPVVRDVTWLQLDKNGAGPEAVFALARSELADVGMLEVGHQPIGDDAARALADADVFARVATLDLMNANLSVDGALAIIRSPKLAAVTHLVIGENQFGRAGAKVVSARLQSLDLSEVGLDAGGAEQLAGNPEVANLESLDLSRNPIGDAGGRALAASPYLTKLRRLTAYDCALSADVVAALRERFGNVTG